MSMIITISGPTAAGKSTLEDLLVARGLERVVSMTTRPPRDGEIDGRHYHFLPEEVFHGIAMSGNLMAATSANGYRYGVDAEDLSDTLEGDDSVAVVVVDPFGVRDFDRYALAHKHSLLSVYLSNDSEVLTERYLARALADGTSTADIAQRMARLFERELDWDEEYDWGVAIDDFGPENAIRTADEIMNIVTSWRLKVAA